MAVAEAVIPNDVSVLMDSFEKTEVLAGIPADHEERCGDIEFLEDIQDPGGRDFIWTIVESERDVPASGIHTTKDHGAEKHAAWI